MGRKEISWEEVSEEYPKLKSIGERYKYLKKIKLEVTETIEGDKRFGVLHKYETKYRDAYLEWSILENEAIEISAIERDDIEKIGPLLFLGTLFYINKICRGIIKKNIPIEISNIIGEGMVFWPKVLGFDEDINAFVNHVKRNGEVDRARFLKITLPFDKFQKLVDNTWKLA